MKIANKTQAPVKDLRPPKFADNGKARRDKFESLLAKRDEKELMPEPTKPHQFRPVEIEHIEAPRAVTPPAIVEGLVREISVVATESRQEVHIELNSKTLDGLRIDISKKDGNVSVQFVTSSPEVERVLQRNMDALHQGLAQRGVNATLAIRDTSPSQRGAVEAAGAARGGQSGRGGKR